MPYGTYSGHENSGRGIPRDRIVQYARKFKVSPEWLLTGAGEGPIRAVPVVGIAGAGPEGSILYNDGDVTHDEAAAPPNATASTVAVESRGESMRGIAEDGWFVYYDDRRDPPTDDLIGKLCVVGLADGRVLVKKLWQGRRKRHFDLESVSAPLLRDAAVEWAAEVIAIIPNYSKKALGRRIAS